MLSVAFIPMGSPLHWINYAIPVLFALWFVLIVVSILIFNQACKLAETQRRREAIRLLEGLALLGPLAVGQREAALYKLVEWHTQEGNHLRALKISERLEHLPVARALGMEVKRRRVECLQALGREQQARQEAAIAWSAPQANAKNRATLSAQASMLSREGRSEAAYEIFKEVLPLIPLTATAERGQTLAQLMTSAHLAGDGDAVLPWAQQLLAESQNPKFRCIGYRMAAIGANNSKNLDLAEQYTREGIAYAQRVKKPDEAAQGMAYLGTLLGKRPDPLAALALFDQVILEHPKRTRQARIGKAELLYAMGRFEEGIESARQAMRANTEGLPASEQRQQAIIGLIVARGYSFLGDLGAFQRQMAESKAVLKDGKLALWCEAMMVYGTALTGDAAATRSLAGDVLEKIKQYPDANDIQQTCYSNIARAAWKLRDWHACEWNVREFESLALAPSEKAFPLFMHGECARGSGDETAARAWYEQAAAVHPELYWSKLAAAAI